MLARTAVEAHFLFVFEAIINRNKKPQGFDVTKDFTSKMAVAPVHALLESWHAGGFDQMQIGLFEKNATLCHRTGCEPSRNGSPANGRKP